MSEGEPTPPEAPPDTGPPPPTPCAECGAALAPGQPYCLECGRPTPVAPGIMRGGRAAGWLAAGLIVLGLGAGALTWALAAGGDDDGTAVAVSTETTTASVTDVPVVTDSTTTTDGLPTDTAGTDTAVGTLPIDPSVTATDTAPVDPPVSTPTPPATETEPAASADDWPAGRTGWTVVVSSVRDQTEALGTKDTVRAAGEPAGVLFSSDFSTLRPGFYVVFSGVFSSQAAAAAQARAIEGQFPGAYPRRIAA